MSINSFMNFVLLMVILASATSVSAIRIGKSPREDGPRYYSEALEWIDKGEYEQARDSLLIAMGKSESGHRKKIKRVLKKDDGRYYIRGAEYQTKCFPNRELGIVYYHLGKQAQDNHNQDLAKTYFLEAHSFLELSISQFPTKRAYDYKMYTLRETNLQNSKTGPKIENLTFANERDQKVLVTNHIMQTESHLIRLQGEIKSNALVRRFIINGNIIPLQANQLKRINYRYKAKHTPERSEAEQTFYDELDFYFPLQFCTFDHEIQLQEGTNHLQLTAMDSFDNTETVQITFVKDSKAPTISIESTENRLRLSVFDSSELRDLALELIGETSKQQIGLEDFKMVDSREYHYKFLKSTLHGYETLRILARDALNNTSRYEGSIPEIFPDLRPEATPGISIEGYTDHDLNAGVHFKDPQFSFVVHCKAKKAIERITISQMNADGDEHSRDITLTSRPRFAVYRDTIELDHGKNQITITLDDEINRQFNVFYAGENQPGKIDQLYRMWTGLNPETHIENDTTDPVNHISWLLNNELRRFFSVRDNLQPRLNLVWREKLDNRSKELNVRNQRKYDQRFAIKAGEIKPMEWKLTSTVHQREGINHFAIRLTLEDPILLRYSPIFIVDDTITLDPKSSTAKLNEYNVQDVVIRAVHTLKRKLIRANFAMNSELIHKIALKRLAVKKRLPGILVGMRVLFFETDDFQFDQPLMQPGGSFYQGIVSGFDKGHIQLDFYPKLHDKDWFLNHAKFAVVR